MTNAVDVCVTTCCLGDIKCLDALLYSLGRFADLASCHLFVSHNSAEASLREMLAETCGAHRTRSLNMDFFDPEETIDSNQHGESLNRLIARTTSRYVVISDPDVIITSPDWLNFCKQHIDQGCFIVGTPYIRPRKMWQGHFPNVWCAMLDGEALRSAKLDMRAKLHFDVEANRWMLTKPGRDCSWQLAEHATKNGLDWISLPARRQRGILASDMRSWTSPIHSREQTRQAGRWLKQLAAREFLYPETDEMCCAHLQRGTEDLRADRWSICAKMAVDMYAEG